MIWHTQNVLSGETIVSGNLAGNSAHSQCNEILLSNNKAEK